MNSEFDSMGSFQRTASPLDKDFFASETRQVARELIGKILVSEIGGIRTSGSIVETEAYLPRGDSACHAFKHRTPRTEVMFGPAGLAYVYPIHAKYCFNIVTESEGQGCAVLIRALEPLEGIKEIKRRRGLSDPRRLTTGPACLCRSLGIDRSINQHDLTQGIMIWVEERPRIEHKEFSIKTSKRIGVTSATSRRLRYYAAGNRYVSGPIKLRS